MQELIINSVAHLSAGKTILYPTDTVWGLGCDATNSNAVNKIYQLKKRNQSKSLIVLVSSFEMLLEYVNNIPEVIQEYINNNKVPTTIIYNNPKGIAKNAIATDNTIAIRIVKNGFTHELINSFRKPIISTSANISGENTPKFFREISTDLKLNVDFIAQFEIEKFNAKSSRIIRFDNEKIIFIRK